MGKAYEVLAIRYGSASSPRSNLFHRYELYGEPDASATMDYFFWVLRDEEEVILVDTGFDAAVGARRGRTSLIDPLSALGALAIEPADVSQVIVSHCHYDHIGNLAAFPEATVTVQQRDFDFWTGPDARHRQFALLVEPAEINYLRTARVEGRVRCIDGDGEVAPGIRAVLVGGHSPGQQVVIVETGARQVVLASDALHFYEEMERDMPFAIFMDLLEMYRAYDVLRDLEAGGAVIVAGHDGEVVRRFRSEGVAGGELAVRLA